MAEENREMKSRTDTVIFILLIAIITIFVTQPSWCEENLTISAAIGYKAINAEASYSNSFFSEPADSPDLIRLSAFAAASTYTEAAAGVLSDCGFHDVVGPLYSGSSASGALDDNDHCVIYSGIQEITDNTNGITADRIVAVIISGYSREHYEWISNFNLGTEGPHKGFSLAADEVLEFIRSQYGSLDNTILWITGHSRGAAITNLVAGRLISRSYDSDYSIHQNDGTRIFAYGFATPNATDERVETDQIINIVCDSDFVSHVPLKNWGFDKNGKTIAYKANRALKKEYLKKTGRKLKPLSKSGCRKLIHYFDERCEGTRAGYYKKTHVKTGLIGSLSHDIDSDFLKQADYLSLAVDEDMLRDFLKEQRKSKYVTLIPCTYMTDGLAYTQFKDRDLVDQGYLKMADYSYWDRSYRDMTEFLLENKKAITMTHEPETYYVYSCMLSEKTDIP